MANSLLWVQGCQNWTVIPSKSRAVISSESGVLVGSTVISIVGVTVRVGLGVRVGFGEAVGSGVSVLTPVQAANKKDPVMLIKPIQASSDFFIPVLPGSTFYKSSAV